MEIQAEIIKLKAAVTEMYKLLGTMQNQINSLASTKTISNFGSIVKKDVYDLNQSVTLLNSQLAALTARVTSLENS